MCVVINTLRGTAAAAVVATATDETHAVQGRLSRQPFGCLENVQQMKHESDLVGPSAVQLTPVPNGLVARVKAASDADTSRLCF
jgi:hypothetical protein